MDTSRSLSPEEHMKKIFYVLYQPYKWLFFAPFFIINSIIFGILAVVISPLSQRAASLLGGVFWARLNSFLTPIFVSVKGRENIQKGQSYIIIANHQSTYDIFVLYGWLGIDFKWVMKKEVRKIPGVGFGSEAVGHIFIDRSSTKAAIETIEKAKNKISGGTSVVFFPEGTRSRTRDLLPFKKGAYRFAFDLNLPLLPVTINGTRKIMPPGTFDIWPGRAEIIIHPPVDIHQYQVENILELINHTKSIIDSARIV
jgi:1-acyl-sn-glycerol-3-phosphate acyltransferase